MYKVIKLSSVGKMPKQMKTIPAFPGCFYSEHAHGSSTSFLSLVPRFPKPSGLHGHCMHVIHLHMLRENTLNKNR